MRSKESPVFKKLGSRTKLSEIPKLGLPGERDGIPGRDTVVKSDKKS